MENDYRIEYLEEPAWSIIGGGLNEYNNRVAGEGHAALLCYALYGPEGSILGGVVGETHWNWLFINLMWLPEELHGKGFGHQLLEAAENEGRKRGATHAYLDTFNFQAPGFYQKHGYRVFGTLDDFPPGHKRYYLVKQL